MLDRLDKTLAGTLCERARDSVLLKLASGGSKEQHQREHKHDPTRNNHRDASNVADFK